MDKGEWSSVPDRVASEESVQYQMNKTVFGLERGLTIWRRGDTYYVNLCTARSFPGTKAAGS